MSHLTFARGLVKAHMREIMADFSHPLARQAFTSVRFWTFTEDVTEGPSVEEFCAYLKKKGVARIEHDTGNPREATALPESYVALGLPIPEDIIDN